LASQFSGYELSQPIFVTAAAAQVFTMAKRAGEDVSDVSAIFRIFGGGDSSTVTERQGENEQDK